MCNVKNMAVFTEVFLNQAQWKKNKRYWCERFINGKTTLLSINKQGI